MARCPNCGFIPVSKNKTRSTPQNKFLHGVVLPILAFQTGHTAEEVKGYVKVRFGVKSTAALSTLEFEQFIEKIRKWAQDKEHGLGCYIPSPNEVEALA